MSRDGVHTVSTVLFVIYKGFWGCRALQNNNDFSLDVLLGEMFNHLGQGATSIFLVDFSQLARHTHFSFATTNFS